MAEEGHKNIRRWICCVLKKAIFLINRSFATRFAVENRNVDLTEGELRNDLFFDKTTKENAEIICPMTHLIVIVFIYYHSFLYSKSSLNKKLLNTYLIEEDESNFW